MDNGRVFNLPGSGLKCGNCDGFLPKVVRTVITEGFITRQRICPNCGQINTTSERVIETREIKKRFSGN